MTCGLLLYKSREAEITEARFTVFVDEGIDLYEFEQTSKGTTYMQATDVR